MTDKSMDGIDPEKRLSSEARGLLDAYLDRFPQEIGRQGALSNFLNQTGEAFSRKNFDGHITATMCIVSDDGESVLNIAHPYLKMWLPPGGHVEAGAASLWQAACQEAKEEAGLESAEPAGGLAGSLIDIDTHPIPANAKKGEPAHEHHDFLFVCKASKGFEPRPEEGDAVMQAEWRPLDDWLSGADARLALVAGKLIELDLARAPSSKRPPRQGLGQ